MFDLFGHPIAQLDVLPCDIRKPKTRMRAEKTLNEIDLFPETLEVVPEWTDSEIEDLHQFVLHKTLAYLLDNRFSEDIRSESISWLMSDSVVPFSFMACCYLEVVDPVTMREKILYHIKRERSC